MAHYTFEAGYGQESHDAPPGYTNLEATAPLPNSQQSSLNDSANSQLSQTRPGSSGIHESPRSVMTPSTTLSNKSSKERVRTSMDDANETDDHSMGRRLESPETRQSWNTQPAGPSGYQGTHTSAPKRTANGEIKSPRHSLPTSPVESSQHGHSRNSSMTSRGSQMGELSAQLRTRLSYAMLKVQHGWQSHNIGELEQLTSSRGSQIPAGADQRRPPAYPIANSPSAEDLQFLQPSARSIDMPDDGSGSWPRTTINTIDSVAQKEITDHQRPSFQVAPSYESFWREHEGGSGQIATNARNILVEGPSLAPAVDIIPRNSRRLDPLVTQPPTLRTSNLRNSKGPINPRTPSPKKSAMMRTPSQQAAVEKDAVETLLFMSSPGNSDYRPHTAPSGTPLRSTFTPYASQASPNSAFVSKEARSRGMQPDGTLSALQQQHQSPDLQAKRPLSDADINRMLDKMPDTSSSDDDDPQEPYPKRGLLAR